MFRANLHPINYACNSTILTCEIIIYIYICKDFTSHDSCKARSRLKKQGIIKPRTQ